MHAKRISIMNITPTHYQASALLSSVMQAFPICHWVQSNYSGRMLIFVITEWLHGKFQIELTFYITILLFGNFN